MPLFPKSLFKLRLSVNPDGIERLSWARRMASIPAHEGWPAFNPICPKCGEAGHVLSYHYGGCGLVNWHIVFDCCSLLSESMSYAVWLRDRADNGYAFLGDSDVA